MHLSFQNQSESLHKHFSKKLRKLLVNTKEGPDLKGVTLSQKLEFPSTPCTHVFPVLSGTKMGVSIHLSEILTPVNHDQKEYSQDFKKS